MRTPSEEIVDLVVPLPEITRIIRKKMLLLRAP